MTRRTISIGSMVNAFAYDDIEAYDGGNHVFGAIGHSARFDNMDMSGTGQLKTGDDNCHIFGDDDDFCAEYDSVADELHILTGSSLLFQLDKSGNLTVAGTISGSGSGAPTDAQYVTLATDGDLSQERVLTGTSNQINITDGGAGLTVVLSTPQNLHTAANPTFSDLTVDSITLDMTQNHEITDRGNSITIQGKTSAAYTQLEIFTADGNGTDDCRIQLWAVGSPSSTTNRERMLAGWDTSASAFHVHAEQGGTGSVRPIWIGNDNDPDAFILEADNDITMSQDLTVSGDIYVGDQLISNASTSRYLDLDTLGSDVLLNSNNDVVIRSMGGLVELSGTSSGVMLTANDSSDIVTVSATAFILSGLTVPGSASASGTQGSIVADTNYIYVCTTLNTWKRVAIATW